MRALTHFMDMKPWVFATCVLMLLAARFASAQTPGAGRLLITVTDPTGGVVPDAQRAAADPRGTAFRTILTREDIDALSDDPSEMAQQLLDIAGGNAVFKIDSFIGGALPPKAMIKSIHVVRDTINAENH